MKRVSGAELIDTYGLHCWILTGSDSYECAICFTELELFMVYPEPTVITGAINRELLNMSLPRFIVKDVEDKTPQVPMCTCDFYSVVMVTGCKCGGK